MAQEMKRAVAFDALVPCHSLKLGLSLTLRRTTNPSVRGLIDGLEVRRTSKISCSKALVSIAALVVTTLASPLGADEPRLVVEDFRYRSTIDGTEPLYGRVVYAEGSQRKPIMLLQHGWNGDRSLVAYSAERMARQGFFAVCLQTRGWGGVRRRGGIVITEVAKSAGVSDVCGIETHDVWDGLNAVIKRYGDRIDPQRISMIGYSYGGGVVYFANVRFPFVFRGALAFFGIPDYRRHIELRQAAGREPVELGPLIGGLPNTHPDLFLARSATLAAGNLSGVRLHIAHDLEEETCPPQMAREFFSAVRTGGYQSIYLHESRPHDRDRWLHGYNRHDHPMVSRNDRLSPMEDRFIEDIFRNDAVRPTMPTSGKLTILGFLTTPRFSCFAGMGNDTVARVVFSFSEQAAELKFSPITSDPNAALRLTLPANLFADPMRVFIDGNERYRLLPRESLLVEATVTARVEIRP